MIPFLISIVILLGYGLLVFGIPVYEVGGVVFYSKKRADKYAELLKNIINQNKSVFINKPKEFSFVGTVEEMEDWEVDCLYRARMMSDEIEASTSSLN